MIYSRVSNLVVYRMQPLPSQYPISEVNFYDTVRVNTAIITDTVVLQKDK